MAKLTLEVGQTKNGMSTTTIDIGNCKVIESTNRTITFNTTNHNVNTDCKLTLANNNVTKQLLDALTNRRDIRLAINDYIRLHTTAGVYGG